MLGVIGSDWNVIGRGNAKPGSKRRQHDYGCGAYDSPLTHRDPLQLCAQNVALAHGKPELLHDGIRQTP